MFHKLLIAGALAGLAGAAAAEDWSVLQDPAELAPVVDSQGAVILDIRAVADYAQGHLEGAVNVPYHAWRGPEDNPGALISGEKLTLLLSEAGVEPDWPVVVTHAGDGPLDFGAAARVYWTLKSAGVGQIAILNGGVAGWAAAGLDLTTAEGANFPSDYRFSFTQDWMIGEDGVAEVVSGRADALLVDARPESFFTGDEAHERAAWAGTLADALNLPHARWFDGGRLSVTPEEARAAARAAGWTEGTEIVSFCNTGHWAATNWFVLSEIARIEGVRLYPESMVGWTQTRGPRTDG